MVRPWRCTASFSKTLRVSLRSACRSSSATCTRRAHQTRARTHRVGTTGNGAVPQARYAYLLLCSSHPAELRIVRGGAGDSAARACFAARRGLGPICAHQHHSRWHCLRFRHGRRLISRLKSEEPVKQPKPPAPLLHDIP